MKHKIQFNRLSRRAAHRRSMLRNMATSLLRYERIRTTKAKARELKRVVEKMITRAKNDSVHNRRIIARYIQDKAIIAKLFTEIAPRYSERPGGYTRMIKLGERKSDAAEMVFVELLNRTIKERKKREKKDKPKLPTA